MSLAPGTRLGPYEVLAALGAGGMGEVYRAVDTKLDREVAIKVLPAALAQDLERLARFEREAKVLGSLNHPNIAQIYGLEESEGIRALVMELVPGNTLKGPLSLETTLNYAKQIADALETAHEKGITHRDLKPANIMITPAGVVKVLDFGLAAIAQPSTATEGDSSHSPTLTMRATQAGMIMGTAAYMAPEQARGQRVDKRADIWAFGVVLYEMVTGRQLFQGGTVSDILAVVLTKEPELERVPAKVRRLLQSCLQKDLKVRLQAIGDWRLLLEDTPHAAGMRHDRAPWVVVGVLVLGFLVVSFVHFRETPPERPVVRSTISLPEKTNGTNPAVSPDGRRLALVTMTADGKTELWVRSLDALTGEPLAGAAGATFPFWSPDSRSIGFFADGK